MKAETLLKKVRDRGKELGLKVSELSNGAVILSRGKRGLALVGGLHGDEQGPPRALVEWLINRDADLPKDLLIIPLVDVEAFNENRRDRVSNRDFMDFKRPLSIEIRDALKAFDPIVLVDLHEDSTKNPYVFAHIKDPPESLSHAIAAATGLRVTEWKEGDDGTRGTLEFFARKLLGAEATTVELGEQPYEEKSEIIFRVVGAAIAFTAGLSSSKRVAHRYLAQQVARVLGV